MLIKIRSFIDDVLRLVGIAAILSSIGLASMVAAVQIYLPQFAGPIFYGVGTFASILVIIVVIRLHFYLRRSKAAAVDTQNVEEHVRTWLDNGGMSVRRMIDHEQRSHFAFDVTLGSGRGSIVSRQKSRDKYLRLGAQLSLSEDVMKAFNALSEPQKRQLSRELSMEMARGHVNFKVNLPNPMLLEIYIRITSDLNEATLVRGLSDIDRALILAIQTINLHLEKAATA